MITIASHPDDELLGCGGTVKRLINKGYQAITVLTAQGRQEAALHMADQVALANSSLGAKEVICLGYPNLGLDTLPLHQLTKDIEEILQEHQPEIVLTHHYGDLNRDHQLTYQATLTALRPLPGRKPGELLCFETLSSTEWSQPAAHQGFKANYFVNISETIQAKLDALQHYAREMRSFPHPRSFEGISYLARVRGMTVGVEYAEAFELVRKLW